MARTVCRAVTLIILFVFWGINIYRAATRSITMDEAYTYLAFVKPPIPEILSTYDANHHVLHSLLCKAGTAMFGPTELTLRVPSLLGGFLYSLGALAICRLLLGNGWMALLCLSILIFNPLTLDFSSVARGYSLGLGFLTAGLLIILLEIRKNSVEPDRGRLALAGVSLGLSISAVLTFLFPAAAAIFVFIVIAAGLHSRTRSQTALDFAALAGPALAVAAVINAGPLSHATRGNFAIGFGSIFTTLKNSLYHFLQHHYLPLTL